QAWTPYGEVLVDKYRSGDYLGAEPFSRFLAAMNAAYRLASSQSVPEDRGMVLGFSFATQAQVPAEGDTGYPGLTTDLNYLVQITNPLNRGTKTWDSDLNGYRN